MAEKKLRIGFIGTGGIAHDHIRAYLRRIQKYGDIEIVAGCDIIPGKADEFFREFSVDNVRTYVFCEDMLDAEKLDAVSVCTYNRQHAAPTIAALKHGCHVILEKPFAVTLEECVEMMRAEKESGKILTIGFQPRFDRNMQQIKKIVEAGELGRVYYIQTGGGRRSGIPAKRDKTSFIREDTAGIGALGDIGCYALDMVLNAIGYPTPLTVTGFTTDYFGKNPDSYWPPRYSKPEYLARTFGVDDFASGFVRLEGGVFLDFRISWAMHMDTAGDTLILGTKAGLRIPSTDCWNGSVGGPMTLYYQCAGQSVETVLPILKDSPEDGDLWDRKIGSFIRAIREGGPAPVPSSQIIKNQAIIDGIVRSAKVGHEIEIRIPEI